MIGRISYRGPDHREIKMIDNVCLAHARLSIIDLSENANQPMFSADGNACIIFNGEIYNYKSLKEELLRDGMKFNTSSDTEVLLGLYLRYGNEMFSKINGMFAFAIYDLLKKELFIARDRMGKKPLYYTSTNDGFIFGSELKAVLQHPSVSNEINTESLNRFLTFDYVPGQESIIKNISKLEPAHYLIVKDGKVTEKKQYWEHDFTKLDYTFDEAVARFDLLLNESVSRRLVSDVPLGVFLSGGLDSSTIAWYAQKNSARRIKTFSIGFEDKSYDEQSYAAIVSKELNTEHHVTVLTAEKTLDLIDEIFPLIDEPFADASVIPTYFLSQFTRKQVTVALGGDGSDEMLGGYPTFISDKFKKPFQFFSKKNINKLSLLINKIPVSDRNISFDFKLKQFLRGFHSEKNHVHQLWLGSFLPEEKSQLFKKDVFEKLSDKTGLEMIDGYFTNSPAKTDFEKTVYYYYKTYLPDDILFKVDRASMYNSLEVRAPFLDVEIVEFLNSLPEKFKHRFLSGKFILKRLMKGKLPDKIISRPKKGFGIPLSQWIRKDLWKNIVEVLLSPNEFFKTGYIEKILSEHFNKKANHRKLIWNLYVFLYWQKYRK
jgi:asparagine synthase (glutamine-hydrolysing)